MVNIKNYTSGVPVSRTVARIEEIVSESGAHGIQKDFESGRLTALCFRVRMPENGKEISIRLPANPEAVYESLRKEIKRPRDGTLENLREQSERTAWKLMQDWVEVQLSLIRLNQADLLQVFLPYVWDGKRTFYEALKGNQFKALMDSNK